MTKATKIYEDRSFVYTVFTRPTAQEWQGKVGETDEVNREVDAGTSGIKDGTNVGNRKCEDENNRASAANNGNFHRDVNGAKNEVNREVNHDANAADQDMNRRILEFLRKDPRCRIQDLAVGCGVSRATIDRLLKSLKEQKRIRRVGGTRGVWEVL